MRQWTNQCVLLARRPSGAPSVSDFRIVEKRIGEPAPGQVLLRTLWLSLDPYMRGRMVDAPSYMPSVGLGDVMIGATVSQVVASRLEGFSVGDMVLSQNGWQAYALSDGSDAQHLGRTGTPPSWSLGLLGMPSRAAYFGLLDIGRPARNETVVVSAASGAVGTIVGQIAKLKGCLTVGIAGGAEKCAYLRDVLRFDCAIDRHGEDLGSALARACPDGIDVYFDNVGGSVLQAVLPLLNVNARVPVCGTIGDVTNQASSSVGADYLMRTILVKRATFKGFIVSDFKLREAEFLGDMKRWMAEGTIRYREDVVEGLAQAPEGLTRLFSGQNFGKLLVRVADPDRSLTEP